MATATKSPSKVKPATGGEVNVKALAEQLHTDGRTLRKFLRAHGEGVGFGSRYTFTAAQAKKQAAAWADAQHAE